MGRAGRFLLQTSALSAANLLMRSVAMAFQVYVAGRIGAAGIGLFQLIMSVYLLALTVGCSGIRLAATRIVAEQTGRGIPGGARRAVRCCVGYSVFFGTAAMLLLYSLAPVAGTFWIKDVRAILSLRILAFTLPFSAASAALGGYFVAMRQSVRMSLTQVAEEAVQILCTLLALSRLMRFGLEYAAASLTLGMLAAEVFSFIALALLYISSAGSEPCAPGPSLLRPLLAITVPLSLSSYARAALSTFQHLLIPEGLQRFGGGREAALEAYGVIQGMSLPILLFPAVIIAVIADLIVPEFTEAQVQGRPRGLAYMMGRLCRMGLIYSVGVGGLCFFLAEPLAGLLYHNDAAGHYIRLLAPLIPAMYMDTLVDGMLKGVGEYRANMRYNIIDAAVGLLLVWQLIPRWGIGGYIFSIAATELLNFTLSAMRLARVSDFYLAFGDLLRDVLCIAGSGAAVAALGIVKEARPESLLLCGLMMLAGYLLLLFLTGGLRRGEVVWLRGLLRRDT